MRTFLRYASLPILHGGHIHKRCMGICFAAAMLAGVGCGMTTGLPRAACGGVSVSFGTLFLLLLGFLISGVSQRRQGARALAAQACPVCGTRIGEETSLKAFDDYSRSCREFSQENKHFVFIDFGRPVNLICGKCSSDLFHDYLDSGNLSERR